MKLDPTNQFIKTILKNSDISNKNILEIGCGSGRITTDLAKHAKNLTAIDPDEKSLEQAKNSIKTNTVTFINGSGEDLSFLSSKKFDIVVYSLSLHHIPYKLMKSSLIQATKLLTENGKIIVIEPDKNGSLIEAEEQFNVGDGDETFVKEKAIEAIESLTDFKTAKKQYFNTLFYFSDESDFFEHMLPSYKSKSETFISEILLFLDTHKKDGKIVLSADRSIKVLERV